MKPPSASFLGEYPLQPVSTPILPPSPTLSSEKSSTKTKRNKLSTFLVGQRRNGQMDADEASSSDEYYSYGYELESASSNLKKTSSDLIFEYNKKFLDKNVNISETILTASSSIHRLDIEPQIDQTILNPSHECKNKDIDLMDSLNSEITGSNQTFTTSDGKYLLIFTLFWVYPIFNLIVSCVTLFFVM